MFRFKKFKKLISKNKKTLLLKKMTINIINNNKNILRHKSETIN